MLLGFVKLLGVKQQLERSLNQDPGGKDETGDGRNLWEIIMPTNGKKQWRWTRERYRRKGWKL